jgi:hypothetical protein
MKISDKIIEWAATVCFIISVALTSVDVFPVNLYVSLVTNLLWLWVGFLWRKWSLITVEAVVCVMYAAGIVRHWFL